ncbi:MAG: hypothetical protein ACOC7U_00585 [Spirochaetota bacterium]
MGFLLPKKNSLRQQGFVLLHTYLGQIILFSALALMVWAHPNPLCAAVNNHGEQTKRPVEYKNHETYNTTFEYNKERDFRLGVSNLFIENDSLPYKNTGIYIGYYASKKSPFFTDFFNTRRLYHIVEGGVVLHKAETGNSFMLAVPATLELGFRINLSRKLHLYPVAGGGASIFYLTDLSPQFKLFPIITIGLELKYLIWDNTTVKTKVDFGLIFDNTTSSGIIRYIKINLPLPFIP